MLERDNPYSKALANLIASINEQISLDMEERILIMMKLDTEEKIKHYVEWLKSRANGEILHATAAEIVRAAVKIGIEE